MVLFTPDDEARLREQFKTDTEPPHEVELTGQARPNVLFEAGMAMGRSEDRTILVELGDLRPFSDIAGRHSIKFEDTTERRQELAQRLELAGCPVNLDATGWHSAGDFAAALELAQVPSESSIATGNESAPGAVRRLSEDAKELLIEAVKDQHGAILQTRTGGGLSVDTAGKEFVQRGSLRSQLRWGAALNELAEIGLIEDSAGLGELFELTQDGLLAADEL